MLGTRNRMLLQSIRAFVGRDNSIKLQKLIEKVHPGDLGLVIGHLRISEAHKTLLAIAEDARRAEVLTETAPDLAAEILKKWNTKQIAKILQEMYSDDAAHILDKFEEDFRAIILKDMADSESKEVEERLEYAEQTAGRLMVSDFLALGPEATVADAIAALQGTEDLELVYYLYIVGKGEILVGVVSLRQLLLVEPQKSLGEIMTTDIIYARDSDDQEEVAIKVARYNLVAIPVLDEMGRLLGIISVDDVIDIIKEEANEDMLKMAGTTVNDPLLTGSIWMSLKSRWPWLLASWVAGMFAFFVTDRFEAQLTKVVLLAGFIPIVLGMGGNVGTQSSVLVVRGLAMRLLDSAQVLKIIFREMRVGALLGATYGTLLATAVYLLDSSGLVSQSTVPSHKLAAVVGLSIFSSMVVASFIGSATPFLLDRLRVDPAIASGPLVTTTTDAVGILVYLSIATTLLNL